MISERHSRLVASNNCQREDAPHRFVPDMSERGVDRVERKPLVQGFDQHSALALHTGA